MDRDEILKKVKEGLGITGDSQDNTIRVYLDSVLGYMKSAGVKEEILATDKIIGAVVIGINDLWNYNSGSGSFSPYFRERVIQLCSEKVEGDNNV